jgi:signal transduction histidine kinase
MAVVIRDINKMVEFGAQRKNLSYESYVQPEIEHDFKVMGDPGRLRQIIQNLLTNSLKFTTEGFIKLIVRIIGENAEAYNVQFEVVDTGIGVEEEVRKKLFQPFSQADSSTARRKLSLFYYYLNTNLVFYLGFGGTGLGLTISKNVSYLYFQCATQLISFVACRINAWRDRAPIYVRCRHNCKVLVALQESS